MTSGGQNMQQTKAFHLSTEKAWAIEDFDYEEFDSNDNIDRKYETGEKKAKASKKCREKKKQNKNKSKQIECIDLSSDEEQEPEMEENDDDSDDGDIEFVDAFFFGTDSSNSGDDSKDPFADPFALSPQTDR